MDKYFQFHTFLSSRGLCLPSGFLLPPSLRSGSTNNHCRIGFAAILTRHCVIEEKPYFSKNTLGVSKSLNFFPNPSLEEIEYIDTDFIIAHREYC